MKMGKSAFLPSISFRKAGRLLPDRWKEHLSRLADLKGGADSREEMLSDYRVYHLTGQEWIVYTSAAQVPLDKLNRYDLIILDIMMPDIDGFSYCDKIRSLVDCPILFLTAKTMENDITFGLGVGADDYLTKPFRITELRARVNAHLRREHRERHTALTFDRIKIDLSAKELRVDNIPVPLTKSEYLICEYLAKNKGQVFSKEQIYETVFSLEGDSDNSTISTHIKNIRAKLSKLDIRPIATVWGIGYKWE